MPLDFVGAKKGLEIDFSFQIITGSGVPGVSGDSSSSAVTVGAIYSDTDPAAPALWQKILAGAGADKWQKVARVGADLEVENAKRYDEAAGGLPKTSYFGRAAPGTLDSASSWLIQEIIELNNQGDLEIRYADGVALFDKSWDDRTGLTYI